MALITAMHAVFSANVRAPIVKDTLIATGTSTQHIQKFQYIERTSSRQYFPIASVDREKSEDYILWHLH